MIVESGKSPISIGVSGSWGSGKSSMVKMIGQELKNRDEKGENYIFLEFNAWLYQGYDDARAALLQSVAKELSSEMKKRKIPEGDGAWDKLKKFTKRINWFQVSKLALPLIADFIPGVNAVGAIGGLVSAISNSIGNPEETSANSEAVNSAFEKLAPEVKELLKDEAAKPATEQIEGLRKEFQELLEKLNVKLSDDEEYYKKYGKYPTFESKLTHLFFCVCKFHCFADGNKRLAITLSAQFLLLNGYMAVAKTFFTVMENISYQVAAGRIDKDLLHRIIIAVMDGTYETEYSAF